MHFYPDKTVVRQPEIRMLSAAESALTPDIFIKIAIDVAYIVSQHGSQIENGIYMMDNASNQGSINQGTMNLVTAGNTGQLVGWEAVPVNPYLPNQKVEITFIQICTGTVFGSPPLNESGTGYTWIGQLMYSGKESYFIQIKVTEGLTPEEYYINWHATAQAT